MPIENTNDSVGLNPGNACPKPSQPLSPQTDMSASAGLTITSTGMFAFLNSEGEMDSAEIGSSSTP